MVGFQRAPLALLGATLILAGCAAHYTPEAVADPYGFFSGIWHGMLCPLALLANLVSWIAALLGFSVFESIEIIGRPNTGFWYYVGFVMGLAADGSGGAAR
jgi:hypothetical protein